MRLRDRLLLLPILLSSACSNMYAESGSDDEVETQLEALRRPRGPLAEALADIVDAGPPGAVAFLREGARTSFSAAGVADLVSRRTPREGDRFRIASVTKPFTAVVILQLEAEGRLRLDDPIQFYLPTLLPAGLPPISIRQLLNHSSGLADYHDYNGLDTAAAFEARRFEVRQAEDDIALAVPYSLLFPPGSARHYTDTNYRVLELLVPAITGRSIAREIQRRILHPLRLHDTSYPEQDAAIRGAHLRGYMASDLPHEPFGDQSRLIDFSEQSIDQTGAAGALISSGPDLLRFFRALVTGSLLPSKQLAEMMETMAPDPEEAAVGATGYGLGLVRWDLGCGTYWGHIGSTRGYSTLAYVSEDGQRQAVVAVTQSRLPDAAIEPVIAAVTRAVCGE